jgi:hypothetical protein
MDLRKFIDLCISALKAALGILERPVPLLSEGHF